MLRVNQCRNSKAAKGYYTSAAEYYGSDPQEMPGRWGGQGARRLGLAGDVDKASFDALCDNRHPVTGDKLTVRQRADRTPGYDLNFHVCKSVSLLYALTEDEGILDAFRWAVNAAMREMESRMKTRVRTGGRCHDRVVGNMAWAEYLHFTARPVNGTPDPHLHAHCFVLNVVYDELEKRWKAGQFRDIKRNAPYYQKVFQTLFAGRLVELGYKLDAGGEIAGLSPALLCKFSRRTELIDRIAGQLGIRSDRVKDKLGAATRERKQPALTLPVLRERWRERLTDDDRAALAQAAARRRARPGGRKDARAPGADRPRPKPAMRPGWDDRRFDQFRRRQQMASYAQARASHDTASMGRGIQL